MNERILALAEQAGFLVDRSGCIMVSFTSNGDSEVKKFAELIVRECAGLLDKEAESNHDKNTPTYNLLRQESKWVKTYFGVTSEQQKKNP